jgi:hypothetical protein
MDAVRTSETYTRLHSAISQKDTRRRENLKSHSDCLRAGRPSFVPQRGQESLCSLPPTDRPPGSIPPLDPILSQVNQSQILTSHGTCQYYPCTYTKVSQVVSSLQRWQVTHSDNMYAVRVSVMVTRVQWFRLPALYSNRILPTVPNCSVWFLQRKPLQHTPMSEVLPLQHGELYWLPPFRVRTVHGHPPHWS